MSQVMDSVELDVAIVFGMVIRQNASLQSVNAKSNVNTSMVT